MALRTDLAVEARMELDKDPRAQIEGMEMEQRRTREGILISEVRVLNEEGVKKIGRPIGHYITIETKKLRENDLEVHEKATDVLTRELKKMVSGARRKKVLIVGLGNRFVTADSLGPMTAQRILTTRHIRSGLPKELKASLGTVSCVAPGVMGQTGIETEEIIEAVVNKIKPDVVVAVDALAAGSVERLNATIQLCDTGVSPGAGMGNRRQELSRETLGVPVLAIGVPTVVDAAILAENNGPEQLKNFYVTTKDMDAVAERLSRIIAGAVNRWAHHLTPEELTAYLY